jgi:hypothetical protein
MSRRATFKVVDYPPCAAGVEYQGRVRRVRKEPRADHFHVAVELLNKEQEGRCVEFTLTFPIRPSGLTCAFFRACGLAVSVDADIDPQEAIGKIVRVTFDAGTGDEWRAASFRAPTDEPESVRESAALRDHPRLFPEEQP